MKTKNETKTQQINRKPKQTKKPPAFAFIVIISFFLSPG